MHHYIHQTSNLRATTFLGGLGAIRKEIFERIRGFDENRYRRPSIEDIELGYRLRRAGYQIRLEKQFQGKHLKRWTFFSLLHSDIFCRAIPWSILILETKVSPKDLNLKLSYRVSSLLVGLLVPLTPMVVFSSYELFGIPSPVFLHPTWLLLFVTVLFLNRDIYRFFLRRKGLIFTGAAICLHLLYYFLQRCNIFLVLGYGPESACAHCPWRGYRASPSVGHAPIKLCPQASQTQGAGWLPLVGSRPRQQTRVPGACCITAPSGASEAKAANFPGFLTSGLKP